MGGTMCLSKLLRRRCAGDCVFAPYFPSDDPHKFAIVHNIFGASNINKMLQELPVHQRGDAVSSLVFEANARMQDPVYGCVGGISYLQSQVNQLQMQLAIAQAEIVYMQMQQEPNNNNTISTQMVADEKSVCMLSTNNLINNIQQHFGFTSSSNVIQEPLKIVSLDMTHFCLNCS